MDGDKSDMALDDVQLINCGGNVSIVYIQVSNSLEHFTKNANCTGQQLLLLETYHETFVLFRYYVSGFGSLV